MTTLYSHYKTLGVSVGAGFADITASYKKLCREHHPDINNDPASEELMKKINIAYTILREKFKREAAFRDRQIYSRPIRTRRYSNPDMQTRAAEAPDKASETETKAETEAETQAFNVVSEYFSAINACDYSTAYSHLSSIDKTNITPERFVKWRKSVARLYPLREFHITGGFPSLTIKSASGGTLRAKRFSIAITEEDYADNSSYSGVIEKLVIYENGQWKVYLGYNSVSELTRTFNDRFETRRKRDIARHWEEYCEEQYPEYCMHSAKGMRKAAMREIYRQKRFGGAISFAALSITSGGARKSGQDELLYSAARTIRGTLRETDTPSYAGDGVFAILLVELRKKNAEDIVKRLIDKIRQRAGPHLGGRAKIDFAVGTWSGNDGADIDAINTILGKFGKKI